MWLSVKILALLWAINFVPPFLTYLFEDRGNTPLDRGYCLADGQPLFGAHKTVRGFMGGVLGGAVVGLILGFPWWLGVGAGFLSMLGDLASSFIKRRLGATSGDIIPVLDQGFEGLFPLLLIGPVLLLSAGEVFLLLVLFGVGAFLGSLFLNRVLLATPFANYPRTLRPRVRFREFRSCQITSGFWRYFVNFEDAFYYHIFMKTVLRLMGVYERGKENALRLKTTRITFHFPTLPSAFDDYTILFLSDLHLDGLDGLTERVWELVRHHPVDLCLLGGDFRMEHHGPFSEALARLRCLLPAIRARDGIIGIMGNHDCLEMMEPLEESGVTVLVNDSLAIERNGKKIWIVGVDDPHYFKCHDLDHAFDGVPAGSFRILLAHSNEIYQEAAACHPQLYLCGHTHGGQIQVPLIGAIFTHSKAPRSLYYGPWQYGRMLGYTTCGVGVSGVPARFATQGEIVLITLKRNDLHHCPIGAQASWTLAGTEQQQGESRQPGPARSDLKGYQVPAPSVRPQ